MPWYCQRPIAIVKLGMQKMRQFTPAVPFRAGASHKSMLAAIVYFKSAAK